MSTPQPPPGPPEPPAWTPPAGWSPEQPAARPQQLPGQEPGPGVGQGPTVGYDGPPGTPGPAPWQAPPGYGQSPPPGAWQTGPGQPDASPAWSPSQRWAPPPQAPKPGIVPLRPLGVGELLDGALGLIRSNPKTVLGLAAVVSAASAIIQTLGLWLSLRYLDSTATITGNSAQVEVSAELTTIAVGSGVQLVPALVAGFLQVLASGLFIVLVGAAVLGRRLDVAATWQILRPRLPGLIGVTLVIGVGALLAIAVLTALIVILVLAWGPWGALPGVVAGIGGAIALVYLYVKLALAAPALVMEGIGVGAALSRSWELVRNSWWRVLAILILAAIITSLLTAVVTVPITVLATLLSGFSESLIPTVLASGLSTLVAGIVTLPFSAAVTGLLYIDLRMRREALDIELTSAGIDATGDPLAAYRARR